MSAPSPDQTRVNGKAPLFLPADGELFFAQIRSYLGPEDRGRVQSAFDLARREHGNARRKSGELFFTHPLTVAYYLAEYRLDAPALIAALLHDVAEDTRVGIDQIEVEFGRDVSQLVDGVTKLKDVTVGVALGGEAEGQPLNQQQIQEGSLHKLFEHTTKDVRVVIIKIFDRLHNMRTIRALPPHKQRQKAQETLAVYAPMANRLGMWQVKTELESLALGVLDSRSYQLIDQRLKELEGIHFTILEDVRGQISGRLTAAGIRVVDVVHSPRQVSSVYRDLQNNGAGIEEIDDALRVVVLLEDDLACYTALGCLHQIWPPIPFKFDDYVAVPRDNMYRSLHTTVVHDSGQQIKIRLRTLEMDKTSEIGVLARWLYKGSPLWSEGSDRRVQAFLENIKENISLEPNDLGFGVQGVVDNVLRDQIRVYTPRGELKELNKGATPIDFGYAIHTEVGNQAHIALVNGVRFPLNRPLPNGVTVRIEKKRGQSPQRLWLDEDLGYIATSRAKSKVKRWFKRLPVHTVLVEGKRLLSDELTMLGLPAYSHEVIAMRLGYDGPDPLYRDLGRADLLPTELATSVAAFLWNTWPAMKMGTEVTSADGEVFLIAQAEGHDLRLCRACNPQPGSRIIGFLRADERVTVHRPSCHKLQLDPLGGRSLKLEWADETTADVRVVTIEIDAHDRVGLLHEITELMLVERINILHFGMPREGRIKHLVFELSVSSPRLLVRILHQVLALTNVSSVHCVPRELPPPDVPATDARLYRPE